MNWLELVDLAEFQIFSSSEAEDEGSATVWACVVGEGSRGQGESLE